MKVSSRHLEICILDVASECTKPVFPGLAGGQNQVELLARVAVLFTVSCLGFKVDFKGAGLICARSAPNLGSNQWGLPIEPPDLGIPNSVLCDP